MTLASLIQRVVGHLESAGIPYKVTGSVASSYYGEPRATRDLDIVIDPDSPSLGIDVIIAKLEWVAATGSERQRADVAALVAIARDTLVEYLDRWTLALGVAEDWHTLRHGGD